MEMSIEDAWNKFNTDGYLLVPKLILDINNLYSPPPFDDKGKRKHGRLGYRSGQIQYTEVDAQVPTSYSRYSYPPFKNVHDLIGQAIEKTIGIAVFPTYYYERFYWRNSVLKRHTDRPACEISVSIQISSNTKPWPIYFKKHDGTESSLTMEDGDGVIYKGIEIEHWREKLDSKYNRFQRYVQNLRDIDDDTYHHQIFFHYVKAQGYNVHHAFDR